MFCYSCALEFVRCYIKMTYISCVHCVLSCGMWYHVWWRCISVSEEPGAYITLARIYQTAQLYTPKDSILCSQQNITSLSVLILQMLHVVWSVQHMLWIDNCAFLPLQPLLKEFCTVAVCNIKCKIIYHTESFDTFLFTNILRVFLAISLVTPI
jgi:hypothetical protein